jgi:beta-lactamase class D OXA-50
MLSGSLPINANAVSAVKEITLLEKTDTYELHGKTGWLFGTARQLGWWVGWIERENKVYPFALNIDMTKDGDAAKRIPIGRDCLKALGKL